MLLYNASAVPSMSRACVIISKPVTEKKEHAKQHPAAGTNTERIQQGKQTTTSACAGELLHAVASPFKAFTRLFGQVETVQA